MCLIRYCADGLRYIAPCRLAPPDADDPRRLAPGPGATTDYDVRRSQLFARAVLDGLGVPPGEPSPRDDRSVRHGPPARQVLPFERAVLGLTEAVRAATAETRAARNARAQKR